MPTPELPSPGGRQDSAEAPSAANFPRAARLLTKLEFDAAFADGRRCGSRFFRASIGPTSNTQAALGLAVSRRVSKLAVQRNRLKRCVRESFRRARSRLPAFNIVVTAKSDAVAVDANALRLDLETLWRRIAALKAPAQGGTMRGAS